MIERRKLWEGLSIPYAPVFAIRRWSTHPPLIEGAAYGTQMVERRVLPDRRARFIPADEYAGDVSRIGSYP